jgi:hypothetical protein
MSVRSGALLALQILKWSRLPCPNHLRRNRAVTRQPKAAPAAAAAAVAAAVAIVDGREFGPVLTDFEGSLRELTGARPID